jgi:hypothetical protein
MTLVEVLAPFGVGEEFVEELSRALPAAPDASASRLTERDRVVGGSSANAA